MPVIIILSILSCSGSSIDMMTSNGLVADNLGFKTLMFLNSDTGFIAGSSDKVIPNPDFPKKDSNQFAFTSRTALLCKTIDGGKTWIKTDFGKGYFTNIVRNKNVVFACKSSEDRSHVFVYSSNDVGITWEEKTSFPSNLYGLFFGNDFILAICSDNKMSSLIYTSKDNGESWVKSVSKLPVYDAIMKGQKLLYLSSNISDKYRKNLLVEYNASDSTNNIVELPQRFDCYFLTNHNNESKFIGIKEGYVTVYSLDNDKHIKFEYSYLKDTTYFPVGYYNNKGEEWIVAAKRNEHDVSYRILETKDRGKNWETIHFDKETSIEPFCFLNNNGKVKAWFYSGFGQFQMLQ